MGEGGQPVGGQDPQPTASVIERLNAALTGRYTIESEIGRGGMAAVYLARDLRHERTVALKVLKPELAAVVGAERFLAEIKTTANLQHPHILPLYDSGEADTFLFFVMPYVEGGTLADKLEHDHQLSVEDALDIARKVGSALDYAHDHGVVHRDIKPGNILLSERGEPMVADFGIALAVAQAGGGRFTETGLSLGTPHYMSPEQATGDREIDPRSDIYALGCVLYEMLTGEPPYGGGSAQAVLGRILTGDPTPATHIRKSIPVNVDHAIRRALERLPADRFESAGAFTKALGNPAFRYGEELGGAEAARAASRWRSVAIGASVAAAIALLVAGWALMDRGPDAPPATREVVVWEEFPLGNAPLGRLAAVAPDGSTIVRMTGTGEQDSRFVVRSRGSLEWSELSGTQGGRDLVFSPDGQWIAFSTGGGRELIKRPLLGGSTVTLAEDADDNEFALAWLDDGTILYEQESGDPTASRMVRIPEDGGEPLGVVFEGGEGSGRDIPIWAFGLPGSGGALLTTCPSANCANGSVLRVLDFEGGTSEIVLEDVLRVWYVETGHVVYVRRDGAVFAAPIDLESLELEGAGVPLFEGVRVGLAFADMVVGGDGTMLYVEGGLAPTATSELVWVDRSGQEEVVDPALGARPYATLALSGDGRRLALSIDGPGSEDVWVKELPDGPLTRLTTDPGQTRRPVWSLDGESVAYITDEVGATEARTVRSDGSSVGDFEVLLQRERSVLEIVFTPDGRGLIFRQGDANVGDADLGFMDLDSGDVDEALLASEFNERAIALSPDGGWLAYVSDVTGQDEVFVRPFPSTGSGRRQVSTNGGLEPVWARNGRELFYRELASGRLMAAAYTTEPTFEVTGREGLFDASGYLLGQGASWHSYDVAPDDQRFVFIRPGGGGETAEGDPARLILVRNWFTELRERLGAP